MTDIVELKRKIAEYLDEYATVNFYIGDEDDDEDPEVNIVHIVFETSPELTPKVRDIVESALNVSELIDDYYWNTEISCWISYDCDENEYETKTIGMDILDDIKTRLREHPELNVTEIDGVSDLTLRFKFSRVSKEKVENVMNNLLRMKRVDNILDGQISKDVLKDLMDMLGGLTREEDLNLKLLADQRERMKLHRSTKRRRLSLRF